MKISKYAKAVVGGVGTITTALNAAFVDDVLGVDETGTLVSVVINVVLAVYAVYKTPNAD